MKTVNRNAVVLAVIPADLRITVTTRVVAAASVAVIVVRTIHAAVYVTMVGAITIVFTNQ